MESRLYSCQTACPVIRHWEAEAGAIYPSPPTEKLSLSREAIPLAKLGWYLYIVNMICSQPRFNGVKGERGYCFLKGSARNETIFEEWQRRIRETGIDRRTRLKE